MWKQRLRERPVAAQDLKEVGGLGMETRSLDPGAQLRKLSPYPVTTAGKLEVE